ncbi:5568_t:CDS:2 [Dentiscutata erythropus]|uniref:5568_t:CDS:1 n=1 Tax=Dentiscutata erythropus TaxID=1348616 RepID=A0A9N8VNQ6_9GLOM|nr:5568_t:CDS:2 [Dentiscutata erythropus]
MVYEGISKEEQKKEYYQAFKLFDNKGNDTIPPEALGDLLRALGQNPSQAEVTELAKTAGANTATYEEFVEGFQVLDKDRSGYISAGELRYVLTSLGEKLSEGEVDELMKTVEVDKNGNIKYEEFIKQIMST